MLASSLGGAADISAIVGCVVVVGGVALARTKRFRAERSNRATVHDVVVGVPPKIIDGVVVEAAKPGLVTRVGNIEIHLTEMDNRLTPNGLNTNNPGDVMGRTEKKVDDYGRLLDRIIDHLGIEPEGD